MKKRVVGLDILRIFSMIGVVTLHILGWGGYSNHLILNWDFT